ncbi:hypothetical protein HAX54_011012, partial [Datura stramonium]|nr:hypothetical protein [Datura stramonium]
DDDIRRFIGRVRRNADEIPAIGMLRLLLRICESVVVRGLLLRLSSVSLMLL